MHQLTISFGPTNLTWVLMFKDEQKAIAAYNKLGGAQQDMTTMGFAELEDEFGQHVCVTLPVNAFMLEDMEQSKMAHMERWLHQARVQIKTQQTAAQDPVIKTAQQMAPIIDPMMMGRGNGRFPG